MIKICRMALIAAVVAPLSAVVAAEGPCPYSTCPASTHTSQADAATAEVEQPQQSVDEAPVEMVDPKQAETTSASPDMEQAESCRERLADFVLGYELAVRKVVATANETLFNNVLVDAVRQFDGRRLAEDWLASLRGAAAEESVADAGIMDEEAKTETAPIDVDAGEQALQQDRVTRGDTTSEHLADLALDAEESAETIADAEVTIGPRPLDEAVDGYASTDEVVGEQVVPEPPAAEASDVEIPVELALVPNELEPAPAEEPMTPPEPTIVSSGPDSERSDGGEDSNLAESIPSDSLEIAAIAAAWPKLSEEARRTILDMIDVELEE